MATSITPVTKSQTAVSLEYTGINLSKTPDGTCGIIRGRTLDSDGNEVDGIMCEMTAEEYAAWGADQSDTYCEILLAQKNGLV